jgi:hypothetical protein
MIKVAKTILNLLKIKNIPVKAKSKAFPNQITIALADKYDVLALVKSCGFEECENDDENTDFDDEVFYNDNAGIHVVFCIQSKTVTLRFY